MPATTAWVHLDEDEMTHRYIPLDIRGNPAGLARCYKLSTPRDLDGDGILDEYVVIRILYRREHMHAEVALFPCDERGTMRGLSVMRRPGSFPVAPCPQGNQDAIEFTVALAFKFHDIEVVDPPEPEPEPETPASEKEFPEGLDYDPDDPPEFL